MICPISSKKTCLVHHLKTDEALFLSISLSLSYLIFLNTTSSSLRCEPWELTAILLHHRRNISETGDCGLLDEYQIRLAIHCSSWRCSTIPRHTPKWSYSLVLTLDELPTNASAEKSDAISNLVSSDQIKVCFYQCPMALPLPLSRKRSHALHLASVNHSFTHSCARSLIRLGNCVFRSLILQS